jgi:hypothetical protein
MGQYIVEIKQEITTPVSVYADNAEDAQTRAKCGLGEFGDQSFGELEIASVRPLDPVSEA